MKSMMMKGMHKVMLSCEQATYLSVKNEYEKASFIKRMQFKMHLFSCKFCRNFAKQSKIIDQQVEQLKVLDEDKLEIHLTQQQKLHLGETVKSNME